MSKLLVFVVDDDPVVCHAVRRVLEGPEVEVAMFTSAEEALAHLRNSENLRPQLIITDTSMPGMLGPALLAAVCDETLAPDAYRVIMSGGHGDLAQAALDAGHAHGFVTKPFTVAELARQVLAPARAHLARLRV